MHSGAYQLVGDGGELALGGGRHAYQHGERGVGSDVETFHDDACA